MDNDTTTTAGFTVRSSHFDWHTPLNASTYPEALAAARQRGFEAGIYSQGTLVATWSPLYGTKIYNRQLAGC